MRRGSLGLVVAALASALALSGCFLPRELDWTRDQVKPGKATTMKLSLMSEPGDRSVVGRFFMAFPHEKTKGIRLEKPRWDTTRVLGKRPKPMVRDAALATVLREAGVCDDYPDEKVRVWRTRAPQRGAGRKFVEVSQRAKVGKRAPGGGLFGMVLTGVWIDDGDGVPEDPSLGEDSYECSFPLTTSFGVRGKLSLDPLPVPRRIAEALRALGR